MLKRKYRTTSWHSLSILALGGVLVLSACAGQTQQPPVFPTDAPLPTAVSEVTEAPTSAAVATDAPTPTEAAPAPTETASVAEVSFENDVLPILMSRCLNCHGGQKTEDGLDLTSHAGVMAGSEDGTVVIAGDAANSKLIQLIEQGKMPKRGPKVLPAQLEILINWINAGALNN